MAEPLLAELGWTPVWILNPDTWPEPDALADFVAYSRKRGKGMVGSRLVIPGRSDIAASRGLKINKLTARLIGLDIPAPVSPEPDPEDIERRMDSPTGPSMYVTRECVERIGLMDESFFLYWEEVDWAIRAKAACGIGYAHRSLVPHAMGTTTGSAWQSRQTIGLFSLSQPPNPSFTSSAGITRAGLPGPSSCPSSGAANSLRPDRHANFVAAIKGLIAGLRGEKGRPDHILARHTAPNPSALDRRSQSNTADTEDVTLES